ncbi:hypothetical protein GCM10023184_17650 [Flaviaesturariibacter amylovorans]|uniref:DUF4258 domain-containing protein n=1 Tax=Flaviaesturariibacter amylovorans TaxID=1084520 RepID=A0ABP8GQ63_9BACT
MATVYLQLVSYRKRTPGALRLTLEQRQELRRLVCRAWYQHPISKGTRLGRVESIEPQGRVMVIAYPAAFAPIIDTSIAEYYTARHLFKEQERRPRRPPK